MEEKQLTGYPHLDRPWMKYYDQALAGQEMPQETIYRYMRRNVDRYPENTLVTYNGKKVSGYEFLENIDKAAGIMASIGVEAGKRIMYLMPNIPETAYTMYADSKIGAVSDYVDPRPDSINPDISAQKLLKMIINEKVNYLVVFESCYLSMIKPIENQLKEMGIGPVIIVSSSELMTKAQQMYYVDESIKFYGLKPTLKKLKFMREYSEKTFAEIKKSPLEILDYGALLRDCQNVRVAEHAFAPQSLAVITHSSGTTSSFPKSIPLKNEGINSYAFQVVRSRANTDVGDRVLHILPYFSAYGLAISHMGFSNADNMIEVPEFSPTVMGKLIKKYRPEVTMGTPNWYLSLPKDKSVARTDLGFVKILGYGGDSMNPYDEIDVNAYLKSHNCPVLLTKGHGMSETTGGASFAANEYNVPGSMGIPLIDTIYGVVDPETRQPVKFEKGIDRISGEFIISSPAIIDAELDGRKIIEHGTYDGMDFIYTKDIGTMDRDGVLTFLSRNDRAFPRYDGFKVKPYEIEKQIKQLPFIKDCIISPYEDPKKFGKMIRADIILKEEAEECSLSYKEVVTKIIDLAFNNNSNVSTRQIPTKFIFRTEYPFTVNNKVDYNEIAAEAIPAEAITVVIDETNVSISGITVLDNDVKKLVKKSR